MNKDFQGAYAFKTDIGKVRQSNEDQAMFFASALALVFVSLVPAKFPKEHTALFFLSTATSLLTLAMVGFYFLNRYLLGEATNNAATLTVAIILFVFAAFLLLLLVNPKLAHWADMEKVAEKDGTVSLKRPRPFVMMEGISHEVCSLAGTLKLGKLVAFYDDNGISIDGHARSAGDRCLSSGSTPHACGESVNHSG